MAQKNAVYQVDNGNGFDEIHFRTNEAMITGVAQNLDSYGYRKLPGGLIMQWGYHTILPGHVSADITYTFPISFPSTCISFINSLEGRDNNWDSTLNGYALNNTSYRVVLRNNSNSIENRIRWFALGY